MACCHHYGLAEGGDAAFSVDISAITFGPNCLAEAGDQARQLGIRRIALLTDARLAGLEHVDVVRRSLAAAGLDVVIYADVRVEPTDGAFIDAARFAADGRFDGYISVGGGSVIDTAKAANLYSTYPAEFAAYVNAPLGEGRVVPGALKPKPSLPAPGPSSAWSGTRRRPSPRTNWRCSSATPSPTGSRWCRR